MKEAQVHYAGKINRGEPKKLKAWLDAEGYAAIRAEESPHDAWQKAEYIQREFGNEGRRED